MLILFQNCTLEMENFDISCNINFKHFETRNKMALISQFWRKLNVESVMGIDNLDFKEKQNLSSKYNSAVTKVTCVHCKSPKK